MSAPMETWNAFYDPEFYELRIGPGGRVDELYVGLLGEAPRTCLDIGCGTGEVALQLVARGHTVTGLDASRAMLAHAERKAAALPEAERARLRWVHADAASFVLEERYERVLLANDMIAHLLDARSLRAVLERSRERTEDDGELLIDFVVPDLAQLARAAADPERSVYLRGIYRLDAEGRTVKVVEQVRYDPPSCTLTKLFQYGFIAPDGTLERTSFRALRQRAWTPQEVRFALELAGWSSVADAARSVEPERCVLVARR